MVVQSCVPSSSSIIIMKSCRVDVIIFDVAVCQVWKISLGRMAPEIVLDLGARFQSRKSSLPFKKIVRIHGRENDRTYEIRIVDWTVLLH